MVRICISPQGLPFVFSSNINACSGFHYALLSSAVFVVGACLNHCVSFHDPFGMYDQTATDSVLVNSDSDSWIVGSVRPIIALVQDTLRILMGIRFVFCALHIRLSFGDRCVCSFIRF